MRNGAPPSRLERRAAWRNPALILALMVVPVAFLAWLLIAEKDRGIESAQKERRGLDVVLPLSKAARLTALHRGLTFRYLNGDPALAPRIKEVQVQVDAAWAEIAAAHAKSKTVVEPESDWQTLDAQWRELKTAGAEIPPAANFDRHSALIQQLFVLLREVLESSGLLFDPQPDSFFMVDAALVRLPRVLEDLGQLRGRGAPLAKQGALTEADQIFITKTATLIRDEVSALLTAVTSALKFNPALRPDLEQLEDSFVGTVEEFLAAAETSLLRRQRQHSAEQLFDLGSRAIDTGSNYVGIAEATLKSLLEQRITSLQQNKITALSVSAVIVLLMFVVTTFLVQSTIAQEALRRTREDLELRVDVRTRELQQINARLESEIDERKRTQSSLAERSRELTRSNAELEQFAYVASHDLQEPLRMVANYLQLIERRYRDKLDSDANEFIDFAVDGAKRMQELINDLLAFSRVGTRGAPFKPTDCDEVLRLVLRDLRLAIEESGAVVAADPLPTINGDTSQLVQLLQNLIANAIKFRGTQKPEVQVRAEPNGQFWRFSIKDNGIGIPSEYFSRIFVLFQRLHGRGAYPGTGIGLAICKKIVERHGGQIWVESDFQRDSPASGSTFFFTLPRQEGTGS